MMKWNRWIWRKMLTMTRMTTKPIRKTMMISIWMLTKTLSYQPLAG